MKLSKKGLIPLLSLLPALSVASAADRYEYWIDNEYAARTSVESSDTDISFKIDFSNLEVGLHYLNAILINSEGQVSVPQRMVFYVPDLTPAPVYTAYYEYWVDEDYDSRTIVAAKASEETYAITLDVADLEPGLHRFCIRAVNALGGASQPMRYVMYKPEEIASEADHLLTGFRYNFNNVSVYMPIEPDFSYEMFDWTFEAPDLLDISKVNEACTFSVGTARVKMNRTTKVNFTIQFENQLGEWSAPAYQSYNESDELSRDYIPMAIDQILRHNKVQQGDFYAVSIDVPNNGTYYLSADQSCRFDLYKNAAKISSYTDEKLLGGSVSLSMGKGTYYGIIYNTVKDKTNLKKDLRLRLSTRKGALPIVGDVNDDGEVDGFDLVGITNFILDGNTTGLHRDDADINQDSEVDGYDYVGEVNLIMEMPNAAPARMMEERPYGAGELFAEDIEMQAGSTLSLPVCLASDGAPFSLVQTDIVLPEGIVPVMINGRIVIHLSNALLASDDDHSVVCTRVGERTYRVLVLSPSNTTFCTGEDRLFTLDVRADEYLPTGNYAVELANTKLVRCDESGIDQQSLMSAIVCASGLGIEDATIADDMAADAYTLSGLKVRAEQAKQGLYIIQGKKKLIK